MKKTWWFVLLVALFIMLTGFASAENASLPATLRSIGVEAFEGTSLETISLPESVETIEDRAFANVESLLKIYIPEAAKELGSDLFGINDKVLITAPANSAGSAWAKEHHHLLAVLQMLKAWTEKEDIPGLLPGIDIKTTEATETRESCLAEKQAPRPGRLTGELKASQPKGIASQYIQSRYFP